jgi:hypothetical protein
MPHRLHSTKAASIEAAHRLTNEMDAGLENSTALRHCDASAEEMYSQ